jgi:hypothetical protein
MLCWSLLCAFAVNLIVNPPVDTSTGMSQSTFMPSWLRSYVHDYASPFGTQNDFEAQLENEAALDPFGTNARRDVVSFGRAEAELPHIS